MANTINTYPHTIMLVPGYLQPTMYIPWNRTRSPLNRLACQSAYLMLPILQQRQKAYNPAKEQIKFGLVIMYVHTSFIQSLKGNTSALHSGCIYPLGTHWPEGNMGTRYHSYYVWIRRKISTSLLRMTAQPLIPHITLLNELSQCVPKIYSLARITIKFPNF